MTIESLLQYLDVFTPYRMFAGEQCVAILDDVQPNERQATLTELRATILQLITADSQSQSAADRELLVNLHQALFDRVDAQRVWQLLDQLRARYQPTENWQILQASYDSWGMTGGETITVDFETGVVDLRVEPQDVSRVLRPLAPAAIKTLARKIDACQVERWRKDYQCSVITYDGESWGTTLTYTNGKTHTSSGQNVYPLNFEQYRRLFENLIPNV